MNILIALSENDKRLLIALLLVLILFFVLIGYLGMLITKVMRWQGKRLDNEVADVIVTRVITDRKHFLPYARKKNWRIFFKSAVIPILIILTAFIVLLIRDIIEQDFSYNPFNHKDGFGTLLFLWDFSNPDSYTKVFGLTILAEWPPLLNEPHLVAEAWCGYVFVPLIIIGGLWYLWVLQSLISRTIRMYKLARKAFDKNLDAFDQTSAISEAINKANNPQNPDQNQDLNK